ncbi:hypothetical protein NHQ30_005044 [Ciborinia camelliae]|nr:hypothetical protein NHQ30_005044 [Ciborinia camelliae]
MNDNDKELMIGVLSQNNQIDFRALTEFLKRDLEPDQITRAMIESSRLRWKGLKERLGIAAPPPGHPTTPSKRSAPKKDGTGRSGKGRKRKADVDDDSSEPSSPSKKKDKGQAKAAIVKLERIDKEDKAFDDAMFSMDGGDYEV